MKNIKSINEFFNERERTTQSKINIKDLLPSSIYKELTIDHKDLLTAKIGTNEVKDLCAYSTALDDLVDAEKISSNLKKLPKYITVEEMIKFIKNILLQSLLNDKGYKLTY